MSAMSTSRSSSPESLTLGQRGRLSPSAWLERQNKLVLALGGTFIHSILYGIPNHIHLAAPAQLPMTWPDRSVPFIPLTFGLYLSDYLLVFIAFLLCRRPGSTARFLFAFFTVVGIATLVHWLWPTVYPRGLYPMPMRSSPGMIGFVTHFRELDSPASCLPSLHVATAFLAALAVASEGDRRAPLLFTWAMLVWASTLTTKQHYLVDGAAGALLALAVWALFYGARSHLGPDSVRFQAESRD